MDQLKPIIEAVKKYHFWVISGAVLLIVLACWWMSTSGLAGEYQQRESKIKNAFNSVSSIPQQDHPNQKNIDEAKEKNETLKKTVFKAWETLYNEQQEKNPFPTDLLGDKFKQAFEMLKPGDQLAGVYRNRYQNYIKHYLPKLKEMIDVLRPVEPEPGEEAAKAVGGHMGDGMAGGNIGGTEVKWTGVVNWNQADYQKLEQRFEWPQTPTTLEVQMAQEDLWVYEALLRAVKNVNEGATDQNSASIKTIDALEIGKDAVNAWKQAENVLGLQTQGSSDPMAGGPGGRGGMPMDDFEGGGGGHGQTPENTEEQIKQKLFEFRYIDDKCKPLPYQAQAPHVKHPYAEFKMMPIRIRLVMDQRKIPELLAEYANSNMPIEVRRVRFLKTEGGAAGLAAPVAGGRGGFGGEMGMGFGGGPGATGGAKPTIEAGQLDAPVEIHAIIYIYNPPDREKLGTGSAGGAQPAAPTPAPASVPAPVGPPDGV